MDIDRHAVEDLISAGDLELVSLHVSGIKCDDKLGCLGLLGLSKFKKQWGAQESILHWQCVGKDVNASLVQNDNAKLQWVMDMWKRLPLPLANFLGPLLRGQLSN